MESLLRAEAEEARMFNSWSRKWDEEENPFYSELNPGLPRLLPRDTICYCLEIAALGGKVRDGYYYMQCMKYAGGSL